MILLKYCNIINTGFVIWMESPLHCVQWENMFWGHFPDVMYFKHNEIAHLILSRI